MLYVYSLEKRTPYIAKKLARKLKSEVLLTNKIPNKMKRGDVIFNYGGSKEPIWKDIVLFAHIKVINHWDNVSASSNKIKTFKKLNRKNVSCLDWTTCKEVAAGWKRVVVRKLICATKSKGILIVNKPTCEDDLPDAPLYTNYYQKTHEFRVHVFNGKVIDYTQKKLLSRAELTKRGIKNTKYIRSYENGWIFSRNDIIVDTCVEELAISATKALELDYCGVDILARFKEDKLVACTVCETNSAPGMVNTTFDKYLTAIKNLNFEVK